MKLNKLLGRLTQVGVTLSVTFASLAVIHPDKYSKYGNYALNFLSVYEIFLWIFGSLTILFALVLGYGASLKDNKFDEMTIKVGNKDFDEIKEDPEKLAELKSGVEKLDNSLKKIEEQTTGLWNRFFHFLTIPEALAIIVFLGDKSLATIFIASQVAIFTLKGSAQKVSLKINESLQRKLKNV